MNRRDFLKSGWALSWALAGATAPRAGWARPDETVPRARNVIFIIYDGFSWQDLTTARAFAEFRGEGRLALERMLTEGAMGALLTHSANSLVTDSAAAATAMGTGYKTTNGRIGVLPDGQKVRTILELARAQGKALGLISTARITHATPAGFAAHVPRRSDEETIAAQYLDLAPEVLLGGGTPAFDARRRKDGQDLFGAFQKAGYTVVRTAEELKRANGSRLLGTFSDSHLPYEIDRRFQGADTPSLAELVEKGLAVLDGYEAGFVVQIEAGRIDHANHANDPATMVWEVLAADEAVAAVLRYVERNPETLVLYGCDHGTGGGVLYGYRDGRAALEHFSRCKASYGWLASRWAQDPDRKRIAEEARLLADVHLTDADLDWILAYLQGKRDAVSMPVTHKPNHPLAWLGGDPHDEERDLEMNFFYATGGHTAGVVPAGLYGRGQPAGSLGVVDNTTLFAWAARALGLANAVPMSSGSSISTE